MKKRRKKEKKRIKNRILIPNSIFQLFSFLDKIKKADSKRKKNYSNMKKYFLIKKGIKAIF